MSIRNNVILANESNYEIPSAELNHLTDLVFKEEKISASKTLNLLITEKGNIQTYNYLYRGVNKVTDVLSFPSEQQFLPILGDIVIDIDVCISQKGNRSWQDEVVIVFLHALLHLLGYEHVSGKQKEIMETKEKKYWKKLKGEIEYRGR